MAIEAGFDVESLLTDLAFDDEYDGLTRDDVRQLVSYATKEAEADALASAPSSIEILNKKTNRLLSAEIDRMSLLARELQAISAKNNDFDYIVPSTGEQVSPEIAEERLRAIRKQIIEIKAALANEKKAEQDQNAGGAQVNLQMIFSEAIDNIKSGDGARIPVTSTAIKPVT